MADKTTNVKHPASRISYVEPNDVYLFSSKKKGEATTPLTPPFEDMCISFNLTVYVFSRKKDSITSGVGTVNTQDGVKKSFTLSWQVDTSHSKPHSFLTGTELGGKQYLTTYYTDITAENYGKEKIIEGLGVEQIHVSFESWYTPTVTIKFVDVRGSSIFGNEEAIHTQSGDLTADNVFGCFMTIPYPLFRLQIKGFLGKPVTYQLTCSDFKAEYNNSTGNFEVVAQFIGYTYGLLTDIPYAYIVAAPYITYGGDTYWMDKCNSKAWALTNDQGPKRLLESYQTIKSALPDGTFNPDNTELSTELNNQNSERDELNLIKAAYKDLATAITQIYSDGDVANHYVDSLDSSGQRQIYMSCPLDLQTNFATQCQKVKDAYVELKIKHDQYKANYTNNTLSDDQLPKLHKGDLDLWETDNFDNWVTKRPNEMLDPKVAAQTLKDIDWANDGKKFQLTDAMATRMAETLHKNTTIKDEGGNVIFDLKKYDSLISSRLMALNNSISDIQKQVNQRKEELFLQKLGWEPHIGNTFKTIMCHLETFIHCILQASSDIMDEMEAGLRTFQRLGLSGASQTDFPEGTTQVGPWPQVTGKPIHNAETVEEAAMSNTLGWVGDFSDNFIEAKLVDGIVDAILRQTEVSQGSGDATSLNSNIFPMVPADLIQKSPFQFATTDNTIDLLASNLANRATALFSILMDGNNVSDDLVTKIGKLDAYNYFISYGSGIGIKQDIFEKAGGGNLVDTIIGICTCDPVYNSFGQTDTNNQQVKFRYEHVKNLYYATNKERHPMFINDGNNLKYVHYYTQNKSNNNIRNGVVPSILSNDKNYKSLSFNGNADTNKTYFSVEWDSQENSLRPKGIVHKCSSYDIIQSKTANTGATIDLTNQLDKYVNDSMFSVVTDEDSINVLESIKDKAASGNITVKSYSTQLDLNDFISKFWKIGKKEVVKYYVRTDTGQVREYFIDKTQVKTWANTHITVGSSKQTSDQNDSNALQQAKSSSLTDEGEWIGENNAGLSDMCPLPSDIRYEGSSCPIYPNIMGTAFYYNQNKITDEKVKRRVKSLLFLQTFAINKGIVPNFLTAQQSNACLESIPYFYLLVLGGLLWRSRYIQTNGTDAIVTSDYTKPLYRDRVEYTLYSVVNNHYSNQINVNKNSQYTVPVYQLFGKKSATGTNWWPDANIMNQLIGLFEKWVETNWETLQGYELTYSVNGVKKACSARDFIKYSDKFKTECNSAINASEGYERVRIAMKGIFPELWLKYGFARHLGENNNNLELVYSPEDTVISSLMKELLTKRVVVSSASYKQTAYDTPSSGSVELSIPANVFRKYVSAFVEELKNVADADNASSVTANVVNTDNLDVHTLKIVVYYYIKNLWDKWLINAKWNSYDVDTFFQNNFIFMDSFYRNTYREIKLNCQTLVDLFDATDYDRSLFTYINDVISKHRCLFIATPDFIAFEGNGGQADIKTMDNLFKPVPYISQQHALDVDNKFVIIYVHEPSKHLYKGDNSEYRWDGFDIMATKTGDDSKIPDIFKQTLSNSDVTKRGYHVPSFGVAVNRQNNTVFKNIRLNMQNPVQTDAAIESLSNILSRANGKPTVAFHGQDIYNVFSNYSYSCEVEMMGNAQIAPLMYFQLLNIPMWRGAYMIYNVQHIMTPGNMTTTFKGMKLCSNPTPWASSYLSYFTPNDGGKSGDWSDVPSDGSYVPYNDGSGTVINKNYPFVKLGTAPDHYHDKNNRSSWVYDGKKGKGTFPVNQNLINLFNSVFETIKQMKLGWNIFLISAGRYAGDLGNHSQGDALDVVIKHDNGTIAQCHSTPMPELFTVVDIIAKNHPEVAGRLCLESMVNRVFGHEKPQCYRWGMLHFETNIKHSNSSKGRRSSVWRILNWESKNGKTFSENFHKGETFINVVHKCWPEFDNIAYNRAYLHGGAAEVKKHFPNYGTDSTLIDKHFKNFTPSRSSGGAGSTNTPVVAPADGQSIFDKYKNFNDNAICHPEGKFEYNKENMKRCVLYFVANGEGGNNWNKKNQHSYDYCGINESLSFYTEARKDILKQGPWNAFYKELDNDVFDYYYEKYFNPYKEFFETCRNPYCRYAALLCIKGGIRFAENVLKKTMDDHDIKNGGSLANVKASLKDALQKNEPFTQALAKNFINELYKHYSTYNNGKDTNANSEFIQYNQFY